MRFSGCNLWSGQIKDRVGAVCQFFDADFLGTNGPCGGDYASASELLTAVETVMYSHRNSGNSWVVCTGSEPLLQLDDVLIKTFHTHGFKIALETKGTLPLPPNVDHVCVSPNTGTILRIQSGHELKLVYPQPGI